MFFRYCTRATFRYSNGACHVKRYAYRNHHSVRTRGQHRFLHDGFDRIRPLLLTMHSEKGDSRWVDSMPQHVPAKLFPFKAID